MPRSLPLLLLIVLTTLLTGCAIPPTITTPNSPATMNVLVRIENQSDKVLEQIVVRFPGKNNQQITLAHLEQGETSAYFPLPEIYQFAEIEATIEGQRYTIEALDIAAESPIGSGSYRYSLTFPNENLVLDFGIENEGRQSHIEPLIKKLLGAGLTVEYQNSVPRETIFDRLWGAPVANPELLRVNEQDVWLYRFADAANAQAAASMITAGGTYLTYTRADGTEAEEFFGGVGVLPLWWQWEDFVLLAGKDAPPDVILRESITEAVGSAPLHTDTLDGTNVQLRIANISGVDFESVTLTVMNRATDYGAVPTGAVSTYAIQNGIYRYAQLEIVADGKLYRFMPIDFMGETPLVGGNYTYVLALGNQNDVIILPLSDDTMSTDPALVGKWYWSNTQHADGTFTSPESYDGTPLSLTFTNSPDPNQAGLSMSGYSGCNDLFGSYRITPPYGFIATGIGATEQNCGAPFMASEQALLEALRGIVFYNVDGETLNFYLPSGETFTFLQE